MLQAWEQIRFCTTVKHINIGNNESLDVLNQIVWHNKLVMFDKHSLFYKDWYGSSILYMGDIFKANGFKYIEHIMSDINFKRRKCTVIFDYVILQKAIPVVWVNMKLHLKENPHENTSTTRHSNGIARRI